MLIQILLQLDIWFTEFDKFENAKHNMKQKEFVHCCYQYLLVHLCGQPTWYFDIFKLLAGIVLVL